MYKNHNIYHKNRFNLRQNRGFQKSYIKFVFFCHFFEIFNLIILIIQNKNRYNKNIIIYYNLY